MGCGFLGLGKCPPPPPPPPPCVSYRSGSSETAMRGYNCQGYRAECTSMLCRDIEARRSYFCSSVENFLKNPGGGTCFERDVGKVLGKQYCSVGDRIKSSSTCTSSYLGSDYHKLSEDYCKTSTGQADQWCSCYNIIKNVCETNNNASGCMDKAVYFDSLVEATPEEFKTAWEGRAACFGGVCKGNKYIVPNANQGCDAPIQICKQDIDATNISESSIEAVCNIGGSGGGDSGQPKEVVFQEGSLQYVLDEKIRSKLPLGVGDFIPLSFEDVKYNRNKQVGLGGTFASIFSVVLIISIVITLLSATGTKRRIFRG